MAINPYNLPINAELRGARAVITNLNAISRALDITRLSATKTFQLDKQIRRFSVEMGATARHATQLAEATLKVSNSTGVSVDNTAKLVTAYANAGKQTSKYVAQQSQLVDLFGMGASQVVEMEATLHHLGVGFGNFVGAAAKFGKKFSIPGLMQQTAKLASHAEEMITKFNSRVVGDAPRIIESAMRTGAVYAKTYGVDIAKGIDMALRQQQRFAQQTRRDRDVYLGLSNTYDELTLAMFEAGFQFEETQSLAQMGREDPVAFARRVKNQVAALEASFGPAYAERVLRRIQQNVDPATERLLMIPEALEKAEATRAKLGKDGLFGFKIDKAQLKDFDGLVGQIREIGAVAIDTVKNLTDMFKTIIGTAFVQTLSKAFQGAIPVLKRFNETISNIAKNFTQSTFWKRLEPYLASIGKVLVGVGAAAGVAATALASTVIPFNLVFGLLKNVPLIGGKAALSLDKLAGGAWSFAKSSSSLIAGLTGAGVALNDLGKAMKVPQSGQSMLIRTFRAMALGIVEVFDGILGGLPTWIAKQFFPEMDGTLGDNVKWMFSRLQMQLEGSTSGMVGGWFSSIKSWVSKKIDDLTNYFTMNLDTKLLPNAQQWGENIGRAIGKLAHYAWEAAKWLFDPKTWSAGFDKVNDYLTGQGKTETSNSWEVIFLSVLKIAQRFTTSMIDEILRPFGKGWIEVKSKILDWKDALKLLWAWSTNVGIPQMKDKWLEFKIAVVDTFLTVKDKVVIAFNTMKFKAMSVMGTLASGWAKARQYYHEAKQISAKASMAINAGDYAMYQSIMKMPAGNARNAALKTAIAMGAIDMEDVKDYLQAKSDLASADAGLKKAKADYAKYSGWETTGEAGLAGMSAMETRLEKAREKERTRLVGDDEKELKRRRGFEWKTVSQRWVQSGKDLGMGHMEDVKGWVKTGLGETEKGQIAFSGIAKAMEKEQKKRHDSEAAQITQRDQQRRTQDIERKTQFERMRALRKPYVDKAGRILQELGQVMPSLGPVERKNAGIIRQDISNLRAQFNDAQSPAEMKAIWRKIIAILANNTPHDFSAKLSAKYGYNVLTGELQQGIRTKPEGASPGDAALQGVRNMDGDDAQDGTYSGGTLEERTATAKKQLELVLTMRKTGEKIIDQILESIHIGHSFSGIVW